ncbi:nucleoside/nucleotide kinase family protein [Rhodococcus sp. AD45-ID]|uniref:nucleoside/nucleotide kinase family protein n=1 Tax=Rhodococcus TaxID=1827 RepID=UPI0005D4252F|nr:MULTISPECIES: nucleoside/nucleotide kinase family protein [Rhodococcus]KJF24509.1 Uridine kinase [Rhodococcus sp. AD45]PSR43844.1 nucleoside/nucleotide kinase family protein [Rhodococcus sp. AD45-ID]QXW00278.1 nucleoside/nucleotide kinase family protein [Rhodococcus globerulus]
MRTSPPTVSLTLDQLASRAASLIADNRRYVLGITGAPGAGKSTASQTIARKLGTRCAIVEMDGFHLANRELDRLGRRDRKGAPDTFDADGYAALLRRLRMQDSTIYAPIFDREIDESIGSAVPVDPETPLIVTEGNYLLFETGAWPDVRASLDAVWYLDVPEETRTERLVTRHSRFGRSSEAAAAWVHEVDQPNAVAVEAVRVRADLIVRIEPSESP